MQELTEDGLRSIAEDERAEDNAARMCQECGEDHEFHWHAEVADSGTRSEAADRLINYFGL